MDKEKYVYLGVDPGKAGFITMFDGVSFEFFPMPEHKVETGQFLKSGKPKTKVEFNENGLKDLVFKIHKKAAGRKIKAAIENVNGRQGWSAQNNFSFGKITGLQHMMLIMLGAEIEEVRPQKWQSFMRQGYKDIKKPSSTGKTMVPDAKAVAKMIVENEYPNIDFRKTKKAKNFDDNKVDSFLICLYLYRINN